MPYCKKCKKEFLNGDYCSVCGEKLFTIGICNEDLVREGDSSEKKVYQCQYCEKWLCERHLTPKLGVIDVFGTKGSNLFWFGVIREWEVMVKFEKDKDGHPDWVYNKRKWDELVERIKTENGRVDDSLNKGKNFSPQRDLHLSTNEIREIESDLLKVDEQKQQFTPILTPQQMKVPKIKCPQCGCNDVSEIGFEIRIGGFDRENSHYKCNSPSCHYDWFKKQLDQRKEKQKHWWNSE